MSAQAIIATACGVLWAGVFYVAVRHRDPWTILVVILAWAVNVFLGRGDLVVGGVLRVVNTGLVALLLVDRLKTSPQHVRNALSAQLHDARRQLHDERSDRASWEARAVAYRRILEQHGIRH